MRNQFSVDAYSTALFSTWIFIPEFSLLFDCGDGVTAQLKQKARKIKHVFLSHSDRDHIAGLLQFHQLNARKGLKIYYPKDSGSFPALRDFCQKFDPHMPLASWTPIESGTEIPIRNDLVVRAMRNEHVPAEDQTKSLSFFVEQIKRKLRPEFQDKPSAELVQLRKELGSEALTFETRSVVLCYSGDTPLEVDKRYDQVDTLIHEATFLTRNEIDPENPKRNKHSSLDAVMEMAKSSKIKRLILTHFSSRYDHETIKAAVSKHVLELGVQIPVELVLPGECVTFPADRTS